MFDWITGVIARLGYFGVAILTLLENIFPPIPSEVVIPLAGFVAAQGDLRIGLVIATGNSWVAGRCHVSFKRVYIEAGWLNPSAVCRGRRRPRARRPLTHC